MKNSIKKFSLFLVVMLILSVAVACTPKEKVNEPESPVDVIGQENPQEDPSDEELESEPKGTIIEATNKVDVAKLSLLDSYIFDIDGDGTEETISLYTAAEKDSKGEIMWDDGQNWKLLVEGVDKDYVLFDDYVQLGTIKFHVYTSDDDFYVSTIQTGTASLKFTEYSFDKETKNFISNVKFETTGNVNMLHSSFGY
ncbi:hypothetical protein [Tissierella sp.]|uniref:hypothetical protein n=1 Tax=Tissierella sp. TaxID=41274 RepID=UPI00285670F4|nr:hypothetical protein [Tissierella sp.]MDR7855366.1 hypothetical protein [Tissierella sp.]